MVSVRPLLVAAAVSAAAACTFHSPPPDGMPPPPAVREVVVVEMLPSLQFSPREVTIRVGDAVEWRNAGTHVHTVTADPARAHDPTRVILPPGAAPFDSGPIAAGGVYRYVFRTPGRYQYICGPHEDQGMMGTVHVAG